jgi:hypothetical protein
MRWTHCTRSRGASPGVGSAVEAAESETATLLLGFSTAAATATGGTMVVATVSAVAATTALPLPSRCRQVGFISVSDRREPQRARRRQRLRLAWPAMSRLSYWQTYSAALGNASIPSRIATACNSSEEVNLNESNRTGSQTTWLPKGISNCTYA